MRLLVVLGLWFGFAMASEVSLAESDFVERSINFVIFCIILWYFASEKIGLIFKDRTKQIAQSFDSLQEQNKVLEKEKNALLYQLEDTKKKADEIVALAKREAMIIAQQYKEKVDRDIQSVSTSFNQLLAHEEKKLAYEGVKNVLGQVKQEIKISKDSSFYLQALSKRI